MNTKNILILTIFSVLMINCNNLKNYSTQHFKLEQAYYQSWLTKDNERGTDVVIELSNIKPEITFQSINFRGFKVPVFIEVQDNVTILKGVLITGESRLDLEHINTNDPDHLTYQYQNKTFKLPLENIKRMDMLYY